MSAKSELPAELAELKKRRSSAAQHSQPTRKLRDDAFKYAIPFRKGNSDGERGGSRVDDVFDHTAIDSAFRFAGKLQSDLFPAGQQNFELEAGPFVPEDQREQFNVQLAKISEVVHRGCFSNGDFDMAFHEAALDLSAGTSAILMLATGDPDVIWEPMSVPIDELELELGGNNKFAGIFWQRKMTVRQISQTWPDGKFNAEFEKLLKDKPADELVVNYDTIHDIKKPRKNSRWQVVVWIEKLALKVYTSKTRRCPWGITRYFRVPGEAHGRGPIMLAMPTIKSLNAAARLQLQAAAIALMGIYTARDDGVFNPDNSPVSPGVFWKVGTNGGPFGASVARLPDPRVDLGGMIVQDMQLSVRATLLDQALPETGAAVKSATEIMERVKRLANDHVGAFARLVKEGVIPWVERSIEVCYDAGLLPDQINIDDLLIHMKVKSPLAIAHEMERVQKIVQWLEMVLAVLAQTGEPGRAGEIARIDDALQEIGRLMGVPDKFITTQEQRKAIQEQQQKQQLAMAAAAAAGGGAPAGAA